MHNTDLQELSFDASLEEYRKQASHLFEAYNSGDARYKELIYWNHPDFHKKPESETRSMKFSIQDAELTIARYYQFETWSELEEYIEEINKKKSLVRNFEFAVEAIINGDSAALKSLLKENPELIQMRSVRKHGATLFHYVGANGVERQKTPKNAVEIAKILLNAGAEVDSMANMYGGDTTLGLVATSIHPQVAGVQIALIDTLLESGANINYGGKGSIVTAALHNGRGQAADYLASCGAILDLESAAGTGQLDVVKSFFNENGSLKANATKAQMELGFMWACEYGHKNVVEFLLEKGVNIQAGENIDLTGLHWAVVGGQVGTIKLLLEKGARLEALNCYGGTALGQALWCVVNGDQSIDYVPVIEMLIEEGAVIEEGTLAWLENQNRISPTTIARLQEVFRRQGAK